MWAPPKPQEPGVGNDVVPWRKVVSPISRKGNGGWTGTATQSLFLTCKIRVLLSSLGSKFPPTPLLWSSTPLGPSTTCTRCVLWVFVQLCVPGLPAIPSGRWNQSLTKFLHILLDLNLNHSTSWLYPENLQSATFFPSSYHLTVHYLMCFSFEPVFHWKMSKYCPHMARTQPRRESLYKTCQMGFDAYLIINHESF